MGLKERGLTIRERPIANFLPLPDGSYLKAGGGLERTQAEVAKFSRRDAERLPAYYESLDRVADLLRDLSLKTPPQTTGGVRNIVDLLLQGGRVLGRDLSRQRDVLDLFTKSARAVLDGWFESEPIKALFGFDSIVGSYASPDTPGSAYVLLHHVFGEVNGKRGMWGHAVGGMGAITQAMRQACESVGVMITTDASVDRVLVEAGRVRGVKIAGGGEILSGRVIGNVNPKLLFTQLIAPNDLEPEFLRRMENYQCGSGSFRMNVALAELPDFTCLPGKALAEHHQSGILLAPSLDYMDEAYRDAKTYGWSRRPVVEMLIPSTVDDSLAPAGQHVASLFCQQFAPTLSEGRSWDDVREQAADTIIDTVNEWAPNFRASVLGRQILSPLDLERTFGLTGGDIFHGQLSLAQLWSARPILGHGDYRGPLKGLYMCGSGTHPGGGVTGLPGRNAAREILKDR
jgi:phytoene dehydrogenase-like protein